MVVVRRPLYSQRHHFSTHNSNNYIYSKMNTSEEIRQLTDKKKGLESELDEYYDILKSHNCDMQTPLVTSDGFPRSDIDVYNVRRLRVDIIRLENDLKSLLSEIDTKLQQHFQANATSSNQSHTNGHAAHLTESQLIAFAIIDIVNENSPASKAGLQVDDELLKFGPIHAGNHNGLRRVAELVSTKDGSEIELTVKRDGEQKSLTLVPDSHWGGRGSLGCHLNPK